MKVNIDIPETLAEITLKQYQKYNEVVEKNDDQDFLSIKFVQIFCNLKQENIKSIKLTDFENTVALITKAFEKKRFFKQRFELNGTEFGFIPDLENISMGEYIDLNKYLGDHKTLHKAMAVLYRPIIKKTRDMYLIEEYEGSDKYSFQMLSAPLDVVLEAQVFFYNLAKELLLTTMDYFKKDKEMMKNKQVQEILAKDGDGTQALMSWLEDDYWISMQSQN